MVRALTLAGVFFLIASGVLAAHHSAAVAQDSQLEELEKENAELKNKLDNIQELVTQAKSDLDDVESEAQRDESCDDTNAYSNATDVEDRLNDIESEASY